MTNVTEQLNAMVAQELARLGFTWSQPAYRYWTCPDRACRWQFCWTTQRLGDGKFAAFIYRPVGKGARSGKASAWKLSRETHFSKRATARRHAEQWYDTHQRQKHGRTA